MTCCSGVNLSHTAFCIQLQDSSELTCWQCGYVVSSHYAMLWSPLGSRCLKHEGDPIPAEFHGIAEFPTVDDIKALEKQPLEAFL